MSMTIEEFLVKVFDEQPEQAEFSIEQDITIDWTSKEFWEEMSNSHHVEIFQAGKSVHHISTSYDCFFESDEQKIYEVLSRQLSINLADIPSIEGNYSETV